MMVASEELRLRFEPSLKSHNIPQLHLVLCLPGQMAKKPTKSLEGWVDSC